MNPKEIVALLQKDMRTRAVQISEQIAPIRMEEGRLIVSASAVGRCPRALAYHLIGVKSLPPSIDSIHNLERGNASHYSLKRALERALPGIETEKWSKKIPVNYETEWLSIRSFVDARYEGIPFEIKSMAEYGFSKMRTGKIDPIYNAQVHCYMKGTGSDRAVIILDNKPEKVIPAIVSLLSNGKAPDDASRVIDAVEVKFDASLWDRLLANLRNLKAIGDCKLAGGIPVLPEPLPPVARNAKYEVYPWPCTFCGFADTCRVAAGAKLYSRYSAPGKGSATKEGYIKGWSHILVRPLPQQREIKFV